MSNDLPKPIFTGPSWTLTSPWIQFGIQTAFPWSPDISEGTRPGLQRQPVVDDPGPLTQVGAGLGE